MHERPYRGLLCIGDPHLGSRVPGFRKDDYPRVTLDKFRWCLDLARRESLLPIVLGDLFHYPRDNANWLAVELMRVLDGRLVLAICGNHDCNENALNDHDSLSILCAAGRLRLLDAAPWTGVVNQTPVAIGGTSWGRPLPEVVDRTEMDGARWVFWLAHHDVCFPGSVQWAEGVPCRQIDGVDVLINGHIHKAIDDVVCGSTTWLNPGNISRVTRGDATRAHVPAVLRIDISPAQWSTTRVVLPHAPFEEVFHPELIGDRTELGESVFVQGLAALQKFKTSGEGLRDFLRQNLSQFENPRVRDEILALAEEVLDGR